MDSVTYLRYAVAKRREKESLEETNTRTTLSGKVIRMKGGIETGIGNAYERRFGLVWFACDLGSLVMTSREKTGVDGD